METMTVKVCLQEAGAGRGRPVTQTLCAGGVFSRSPSSPRLSLWAIWARGLHGGLDPHPPTKWLPNASWRKATERSSNSKEEALERALGFAHSIKTASEKSLYCRQKYIISGLFPWRIAAK